MLRSSLLLLPPASQTAAGPSQVKECLRLAALGKAYQAPPAGGKLDAGGEANGGSGADASQRQEQQLHEDKEVLREQQAADAAGGAAGDVGGIGQAGSDGLLEEGLLDADKGLGQGALGSKRGAVTKRIGESARSADAGPVGTARLALFGVLLWAGSLVMACFLLPWARQASRRSAWRTAGGGTPYKSAKGMRDD